MVKKGRFVFWMMCCLMFLWPAGRCCADPQALLAEARQYKRQKRYAQAESVYQAILADSTDSGILFRAQEKLTVLYVAWGKDPEAQAALSELLSGFSDHKGIEGAIDNVADEYRQSGKFDKARQLYQYVVEHWPRSQQAEDANVSVVLCDVLKLVESGDDTAALRSLSRLIADFAGYENIAKTVYRVAQKYRQLGNYKRSALFYSYVRDKWPQAECAGKSRMMALFSEAMTLIKQGDDEGVEEKVNELIAQFRRNPDLPGVISMIAEEYYKRAIRLKGRGLLEQSEDFLRKAIKIHTRVITEFPRSDETPHAYCWLGRYYRQLGDYQKSIDFYQRVVDDYPDFRSRWDALHIVGANYESLVAQGGLNSSQAYPKIRAVYEQLVQEYPNCPRAAHARQWLNQHNAK